MSQSLKDQLLGLGFKSSAPASRRKQGRGRDAQRPVRQKKGDEEIDLGRAWALRARHERAEQAEAERQRQEEARRRREARARLEQFLRTARLNAPEAEQTRHFEYGGRIRRIHVTPDQLQALNAGRLAVVQLAGGYHLVTAEDGREADTIMPGSLALWVDPEQADRHEGYDDPRFQIPDDLVW